MAAATSATSPTTLPTTMPAMPPAWRSWLPLVTSRCAALAEVRFIEAEVVDSGSEVSTVLFMFDRVVVVLSDAVEVALSEVEVELVADEVVVGLASVDRA